MTQSQEFIKVEIVDNQKKYVDITLDMSLVAAYSHYIDQTSGLIDTQITQVFLNGVMGYLLLKITYNDFDDLIQAL